jgi:GNAT superfamily N-acetyltransferase
LIIKLINDSYWAQQEPFFIDSSKSRKRMSIHRWDDILLDLHQKAYVLQETTTLTIVGVIVLEIPQFEEYAKFGVFAISKTHQGKKLGEILIRHLEELARRLLKKSMRIEVFAFAHHLETYYQKLGYVYTERTNSFFHAECIKPEYRDKASQYLRLLEKNFKLKGE